MDRSRHVDRQGEAVVQSLGKSIESRSTFRSFRRSTYVIDSLPLRTPTSPSTVFPSVSAALKSLLPREKSKTVISSSTCHVCSDSAESTGTVLTCQKNTTTCFTTRRVLPRLSLTASCATSFASARLRAANGRRYCLENLLSGMSTMLEHAPHPLER